MSDEERTKWLRRSYTRSIPTTLRSLKQLEESAADAEAQWHELAKSLVSTTEGEGEGEREEEVPMEIRREISRKAEAFASQLKAVMQELTAQMGRAANLGLDTQTFEQYCVWAAATSQSSLSDVGLVDEDRRSCELLARVCMLCLCVSVVIGDLKLLVSTMSFAESHRLVERYTRDISYCGNGGCNGILRSNVACTFFLGCPHDGATRLPDGDVLSACILLYCLFTQSGKAATIATSLTAQEASLHALETASESEGVPDSSALYRMSFLHTVLQMLSWVEGEDFPRIHRCLVGGFHTEDGTRVPLPPLISLFISVMLHMVVRRRLVDARLHDAFRPVINVEAPAGGDGGRSVRVQAPYSLGELYDSCCGRFLGLCFAIQRDCMSVSGPWPLPTTVYEKLFY
ncbi:unnamed protein product [Trypanosoma congolense IL3000]|uniref:WGS project CAEQ00000000 data, annotated contig 460 n=1 Tax=Trypanosoma congolense (strain IL3000) TaxID=1068625 RepID=F9WG31_TRYCI|nr:unnamed protein product [Trypanosoma congolense IL3000]